MQRSLSNNFISIIFVKLTETLFVSLNFTMWRTVTRSLTCLTSFLFCFLGWFAFLVWGPSTAWYHSSGKLSSFAERFFFFFFPPENGSFPLSVWQRCMFYVIPVAAETQAFGQGPLPWPVLLRVVWPWRAEPALRPRLTPVPWRHCYSCLCPAEGKEKIWKSHRPYQENPLNHWFNRYNHVCIFLIVVWRGCVWSLWQQCCSGGCDSEDLWGSFDQEVPFDSGIQTDCKSVRLPNWS